MPSRYQRRAMAERLGTQDGCLADAMATHGVRLVALDMPPEKVGGLLESDGPTIVVNAKLSDGARTWWTAMLMGAYRMGPHWMPVSAWRCERVFDRGEIPSDEAKHYAGALLMPVSLIDQIEADVFTRLDEPACIVSELSRRAEVHTMAAAWWVANCRALKGHSWVW